MRFDLNSIVPNPTIRKWIYGIYAVAVLVAGAIGEAFASVQQPSPEWLLQATAVLGYLSIAVVGLAVANTPPKEDDTSAESIAKRIENS